MKPAVRYSLLGLGLAAVVSLTPFRFLKVSGESMSPTLKNGETYLLDHFYWKPGGLRRNDVVVVQKGTETWVKRLVGLPGDRLRILRGTDERIRRVDNLTANAAAARARERGEMEEIKTLAADEIFLVGDNSGQSTDSTSPGAGHIKVNDAVGVVRTFLLRREFPLPAAEIRQD